MKRAMCSLSSLWVDVAQGRRCSLFGLVHGKPWQDSDMEIAEHVAALEREGVRLAAAAASDLDADVPPCPQWTVRDVVVHTGGVHRWAASIVRDQLAKDPAPTED